MLYLAALFSGVAALIFQIIITRQFGLIFGNTVESNSVVVGTFLLGLGIGAFFAGKWADALFFRNQRRLIYFYSLAEVAIAILTAAIVSNFAEFENFSAALSHYRTGDGGWFYLSWFSVFLRVAMSVVIIFPVTVLMGATLPMILRYLQHAKKPVAHSIGWLYGINTLGAAIGCLATDSWLIPSAGLISAQYLASACSLCAAALALFARAGAHHQVVSEVHESPKLQRAALFLAFSSGFVAIALEILWLRFATVAIGPYRIILSLLLFCFLFCMHLGSIAAVPLIKKFKNKSAFLIVLQMLIAISSTVSLLFYQGSLVPSSSAELLIFLWPVLKLVGVTSFLIGINFPVINSVIQTRHSAVGTIAGRFLLINAYGSFAAAIILTFFILPAFGIKGGLLLICLLLLASSLLVFDRKAVSWAAVTMSAATAVFLFATGTERILNSTLNLTGRFASAKVLAVREGLYDSSAVLDIAKGQRALLSNGVVLSTTALSDQRYMRAFAHVPLIMHPKPEQALVICYGIGNTANAISLHPSIKSIEIADISKVILDYSEFFRQSNLGVLNDPRVSVFVNDGRQHLRMSEGEKYDLVTAEPPPLYVAGVEALYTENFNRMVYKSLRVGGYFTQWLPIWHLDARRTLSVIKAFASVFPETMLIEAQYGHYILVGRKEGKIQLTTTEFADILNERPLVKKDLLNIDLLTEADFFGMFVAHTGHLRSASDGAEPLTDFKPQLEYTSAFHNNSRIPVELFDEAGYKSWCADCSESEDSDLRKYLKVATGLRHHEKYVTISYHYNRTGQTGHDFGMDSAVSEGFIKQYPYLSRIRNKYFK